MKRMSDKWPIYIHPRLKGTVPTNSIYTIARSLKDLPVYVGNTTQPDKRYKRYVSAIRNPAHQTHESVTKVAAFRELYVPDVSPVMVLIDEETDNNEREKYWRMYYEDHGAQLINSTGKLKRYPKVMLQNAAYNGIDALFEHGWMWLAGFVVMGFAGFMIVRNRGKGSVNSDMEDINEWNS